MFERIKVFWELRDNENSGPGKYVEETGIKKIPDWSKTYPCQTIDSSLKKRIE
jgi:hypothetical protein